VTQGIGFVEGRDYSFEGFSIRLGGLTLVPTGLVYPELRGREGQIIGVNVIIATDRFHGEHIFDFPISVFKRMHADLAELASGNLDRLIIPATMWFMDPFVCECLIEHPPWSHLQWQVHVRLSNCQWPQDRGTYALMETRFSIGSDTIAIARDDTADFLRWLSSMDATA